MEQRPWAAADDEDQALARAARAGDAAAFDALVQRHWRKVASLASRLLDDPDEVEDAVQETFLRAYEHLGSFRAAASVRTWLLRIAVNVCKNRRGSWWRRRVWLAANPGELAPRPPGDPLAAAVRQQELAEALGRLPERQRLPVVLHFYEELSGAEIAAVLGWNESTVWSRIYAGCRALRKHLAAEPAREEEGR
jgi:RNA polymerase sigma-70 factor (ECF subfamily)